MPYKKLTLSISLAIASFTTHAATSFDTRSFAMGGIGTSTADYLTAPFHNPALVAKYDETDDFGLLIPSFGVAVQSNEDFLNNLNDAADGVEDFNNGRFSTVEEVESNVIKPLSQLQGNGANVRGGAGIAIAVPNETLSFNIFTQSYLNVLFRTEISDSDLQQSSYQDPNYNPGSQVTALGISVTEIGAALARSSQFNNGTLYWGLSPKIQSLSTINYTVTVQNYDFDDAIEDNSNDKTAFNMDIGAAYSFHNGMTVGLAGKNLISQKIKTVKYMGKTGEYTLNAVYRVSASYQNDFLTVGVDIDLNKTKNFTDFTGFINQIDLSNDDTQMAAIGAEFNAWDWAQLRVGYNTDIQGNLEDEFTAGIGLSPFEVFHIDLSGSYAGDNQFGASVQTYFTF